MKTNIILIIKVVILAFFVASFGSCDDSWEIEERNWKLTWQDEFDTDGPLDTTKWTYDLGAGGWGNNELQSYTSDSANVYIYDGSLRITAIRDGYTYTSARVLTKGLFEQQYGRFEASIKLPYGPGIWPAFWMLGNDIDVNEWPLCGEIDIMEARGQEPQIIHGSLHGPGYSGGSPITSSFGLYNDRYDIDFHLYAVEWGADYIHFYMDDILYQEIAFDDVTEKGDWVYDHPFFILLNVAVGGNYVGFPTDETPFPQTMYIDYVRVYEEE